MNPKTSKITAINVIVPVSVFEANPTMIVTKTARVRIGPVIPTKAGTAFSLSLR